MLDGEICCLDPDGRSNFKKLLFRREWPFFVAFDLIAVDGDDLQSPRSSPASGGEAHHAADQEPVAVPQSHRGPGSRSVPRCV
jgi:hypothetical protein